MRTQCSIYLFFEAPAANYRKAECGSGHTEPKPYYAKPVMAKHCTAEPENEERESEIITCAHIEVAKALL